MIKIKPWNPWKYDGYLFEMKIDKAENLHEGILFVCFFFI